VPSTGTLSGGAAVNGREIDQLASSGGFQTALRLLASVIEVPGGVSIKGGLPPLAAATAELEARLTGRKVSGADVFAAARDLLF